MAFEDSAVSLISSVGFPIFMCMWFMLRTEKVIKANTEVIKEFIARGKS